MAMVLQSLSAEMLKLKHTLAFWLALVAPLSMVVLESGMWFDMNRRVAPPEVDSWLWYGQPPYVFWCLLIMPLFVTLETALVGQLEHAQEHWKHLYALPVPRGLIYGAKQFAGMFLIGVSCLALPFFTALGGLFLRWARPAVELTGPIPWFMLFKYSLAIYLGAWLIITIQTWISQRWKSFVVACTAGILLTIAGVFVINADWGQYWPWAIAGIIGNKFNENVLQMAPLLVGSIGGVVTAFFAGWDVVRRDVL